MMASKNNNRLRFLGAGIILIIALFTTRLFFLQVVNGAEYNELADRQYLRSARTFFGRGSIYFSGRDGQVVPAASLRQDYLITINPQLITEPEVVYDLILPYIPNLDKTSFLSKARAKERLYEEVAGGLSTGSAEAIKELQIRGVYVYKEKKRFYPAGRTASHVLGFMGYRDNDYTGLYGLEREYDQILAQDGSGSFASFFAEIFLGVKEGLSSEIEGGAGDIVLTIEPIVQSRLEKTLAETANKYNADAAGAIIMDPHTGEIIAMAAVPDFDPGERQRDISALPNPLVERVFEMGSVLKPLTLAAGLDSRAITVNSTFNDTGSIVLNNRTIMNHDKKARGVVSMQEVINNSLNTGAVYIMQRMGKNTFRDYMLAFGLGNKTGIDLPGEIKGLVGNLKSPREVEYATAAFGQGIALTPIGMTRAFAVLANGGKLVQPYVVKEVRYDLGPTKTIKPKIIETAILRRETTEEVTQILINAVDKALLGGTLSLPNYSVAAKTGTAQMSNGRGGYFDDKYLHSLFGYYPAYNPRFVTFIYMVNPKGAGFSSDTLSRPFMDTAKFLLNYYEIPPDR